jgi:hypothetical protein
MSGELEASYRRLLRLYPPGYRARREVEMLDVLMQSAPPEQRRPAARDAADLIRGAARAWVRWVLIPDVEGLRDAAALLAASLPMLHISLAAEVLARGAVWITHSRGVPTPV